MSGRSVSAKGLAVAVATAFLCIAAQAADPNSPTGTAGLIAVDKRGSKIFFFDPATYKSIVSIPTDTSPHEIAIAPDHKTAYVSIYGDGVYGANPHPGHTILVMDLVGHKIADTIDVSPHVAPHGIMIGPDGMLYVTCDQERKLLIVDPKTKKVTDAIDTEGTGHWFTLLPDASKAYISNKEDKTFVSVIDLKQKKLVARIPSPQGTEGIAASPDGKRVIFAQHYVPALTVVDTATDKIIEEIPLENYPKTIAEGNHNTRVRFSPDGKWVLTSYFTSGVVTAMPADDLKKQTLIVVAKGPMGFAFAADGHTALVTGHDYSTVSVLDLAGTPHYVKDFPAGLGIETLAYY